MKKNLKRIISIMLVMVLALPFVNVYAQSAMKIERKTYITTGTRKEAKFYTNKGYAYCITPDRVGAGQGATLNYMSKETKGGVLYLLEKTGTSDQEYLVTQLAMWILRFNYMPDYYVNNSSIDVVKRAKVLAAEAAKQGNYTSTTPTVNVTTNNTTLSLTSDGKYYKSSVISVGPYNGNNTPKIELVNAPTGAQIKTVESGAKNNTKTIEVVIPASSVTIQTTFQVKATITGTVNSVERYTTGNNQLQDLVVLVPENKTVTKSINLSVTPVVRKCEYYNNQYYGKDGTVVTKEVYESQCLHKCQHIGDKYYDKDGHETTEETYKLQCFTHTCEKVGDKYFGKSGTEVTEATYNLECFTHTCEKVGDKYFGKDGTEVIETDYKAQCEPQQVIVPNTGSSFMSNIISIVIGSTLLGTAIGTVTYYHDKKKIKM